MRAVHDELLDKVVALAAAHVIGPGDRPGVTMGPLVDAPPSTRWTHAVADGRDATARPWRAAAHALDDGDLAHGCFFPPTVLVDVGPDMRLGARRGVRPGDRLRADRRPRPGDRVGERRRYGLSAAICTRDIGAAQRFAAEIQAGMVRVNRPTVGAAFNAPFGGIKQSGTGTHKEQLGPTVMDFYTVHSDRVVGELTWTSGSRERRALVLGSSSGLGRADRRGTGP